MASNYTLPPPPVLEIHDQQAAEKWKKFKLAWTNYSLATGLSDKAEPVQVATLLTVIGEEAREVFSTFSGDTGVRDHPFFEEVDWQNLLREKAEFFIPQLKGEEDTSYFDSRDDRYTHEFVSDDDEEDGVDANNDPLQQSFANFSQVAPRFCQMMEELQSSLCEETDPSTPQHTPAPAAPEE
ncbi:Microtubule-associated serine/threonine-protein kinase 1 [Geodia barretti]|uniref:Microtubule-associated serine/threonine-protein kinase 1 n=1 Tax=Geodia barretti TaxID=519541 RepID=A0AA35S028_GEOBA|nr:Microtubule-associated serine/threonine-protein kinase 1 [Geodia barretti]